MNPESERLTGWVLHDAIGRPLEDVFRILDETTRRPVESLVERIVREGVILGIARHAVLVARDGSELAIADSGAPMDGREGELRGVVLNFRDQTEERAMQRTVVKGAARVQVLAESSREFSVASPNVAGLLDVITHRVGELP